MGAGKLKHKEVHNILPSVAIAILLLTHSMYPLSNFPIPAWLESFYHMILIQLILSAKKIKKQLPCCIGIQRDSSFYGDLD